jgi:hypothetical protein
MGTLVSVFGALLLLFLTLSGLLLMVAPALGWRMLRKTVAFAGLSLLLLFALNFVLGILRAINPLFLILGLIVVSSLAYLIRERGLNHSKHTDSRRHNERTPVMPQQMTGDEE